LLIKDWLKEFTFDLQIKNYSKRTIETYNYNTDQFIQFLKDHVLELEIAKVWHPTEKGRLTPFDVKRLTIKKFGGCAVKKTSCYDCISMQSCNSHLISLCCNTKLFSCKVNRFYHFALDRCSRSKKTSK